MYLDPKGDDAPVRIDAPTGYSWDDDVSSIVVEADDRASSSESESGPGGYYAGYAYGDGDGDGEAWLPPGSRAMRRGRSGMMNDTKRIRFRRRRLRWPPYLGAGLAPRFARSVWALIAVGGVGAFIFTLVPIRPRWRCERRSLRILPVASLRPPLPFNPRPRRLSTTLLTPFNSTLTFARIERP